MKRKYTKKVVADHLSDAPSDAESDNSDNSDDSKSVEPVLCKRRRKNVRIIRDSDLDDDEWNEIDEVPEIEDFMGDPGVCVQPNSPNIFDITEMAVVKELNETRHSMSLIQSRLILMYNRMKTLEKTLRTMMFQMKKKLDYLTYDELRQFANAVFKQSIKLLLLFDMPMMTIMNRLLASQTFYFVPNTDNNTNGNNRKITKHAGPTVFHLGNFIISNVIFTICSKPYMPIYEIFGTPTFTKNMSYEIHNLPRFISIDYKRNISLAWYQGDNNIENCFFRKITLCHILPVMVRTIEHPCLHNMFAHGEEKKKCVFIESSMKPPFVRNMHDSAWMISVAEDICCIMTDKNEEEKNENRNKIGLIDDSNDDNIIIKKFAIIRLPCKHILTCRLKITLKNMNCKHDSDEQYYLRCNGNYYKTEKLINLLKTDPIDEQQILGFVNDANHINM
ncbi:unnamed protein product, partial [Didymodactylos carnosus]